MLDGWLGENIHDLIATCLNPLRPLSDGFLDKNSFTVFAFSLFYLCWNFRNDRMYDGKLSTHLAAAQVNRMASDFLGTLSHKPTFDSEVDEKWIHPPIGEWKINTDAACKKGAAMLGVVVRDDCRTLILACTKLTKCSSAFEAEVQAVKWATSIVVEHL